MFPRRSHRRPSFLATTAIVALPALALLAGRLASPDAGAGRAITR